MKKLIATAAVAGLGLSASAFGQNWAEADSGGFNTSFSFGSLFMNHDAGKRLSTANVTDGIGSLTTITGFLHYDSDVDIFQINITDPGAFSAAVTNGTAPGALALFDASGAGIAYNRDGAGAATTPALSSAHTAALAPGLYYLAVAQGPQVPLNAAGEAIFSIVNPEDEVGPNALSDILLGNQSEDDGMGLDAYGPWANANVSTTSFSFPYTVTLTGASYAIPAPGATALLGLGGLMALRRRR